MATVNLTKDNFEQILAESEVLFIDFWASWCGPCRMFAPTFEKLSEEFPTATFGKVNTEEERELAGMFGIRSIPTIAIFRDQIGLYREPGALPEPAFRGLVEQTMGLDMDEVRTKIAAAEAEAKAAAAQQAAEEEAKASAEQQPADAY